MGDFKYKAVSAGFSSTGSSITDAVFRGFHETRYEPFKRNKDGLQYVGHPFSIKEGISAAEVMTRNICQHNALLSMLMHCGKDDA